MDSSALIGVFFGLATALFLGFFMAPRRYYKADSLTFLVGMTFGAALGNGAYWVFSGMPFEKWPFALCTLLPGLNWSLGTFAYAAGTYRVGLAKATGIKNTQVVVSTLGAFIIFHEAAITHMPLAIAGSALVVVTALVLSRIKHDASSLPHASRVGYLLPVIASVLYGVNGNLMKWLIAADIPRPQINLGIGLGAFLGGATVYIIVRRSLDTVRAVPLSQHVLAVSGGLIWAMALICMVVSIDLAGLAVGWALLNLSTVVSVLYGVIFLREIHVRRWRQVAFGLFLACGGIFCLYLSKVFGGS